MIQTDELEPLSNDLTTITTEIKSYENTAGQSIFEIGRRLKWVKEHDLAHGEFGGWLKQIHMNQDTADRFMKIVSELRNYGTYRNLGVNALYQIATMPAGERNKPQKLDSGETKKPKDMTVRELRETKRKLKDREQTIANQQAELEDNRKTQIELNRRLSEKSEPKVVEKTITKEVKPDDYDKIKSRMQELEKQSEQNQKDIDYYKRELKAADRIKEQTTKWDKSEEAELKRKKRKAEIHAYDASLEINKWIPQLQNLSQDDIDRMGDEAQQHLSQRLEKLQQAIDRLNTMLGGTRIIEGEIQ